MARNRLKDVRRRVYQILEQGPVGDRVSKSVDRFLVILILINLIAVTLNRFRNMKRVTGPPLRYRIFLARGFYDRICLRLWSAVEHGPHQHLSATQARLKYVLSPAGIIDLIAVLPFWFAMVLPGDLRVVLVFRMVRFFKFARYSPAMRSCWTSSTTRGADCLAVLLLRLVPRSSPPRLMHLAEANVQPVKLGTIPEAFWWAIVTIGTIGYGDVVPVTALGKLIATCTIFAGLVLMALPVGIIATAFAEQIQRRDFIVTWGMISRVPLFAELDATEISDVMELLRAQVVEAGEVVMRAGEAARSMYFIAAGEVEIRDQGQKGARPARRRPIFRRGGAAAPDPPHRDRYGDHPDQPAGARCS